MAELEFLRAEMENRALENLLTRNRFETITDTLGEHLDEQLVAPEKQRFMDDLKNNLKYQ